MSGVPQGLVLGPILFLLSMVYLFIIYIFLLSLSFFIFMMEERCTHGGSGQVRRGS